MLYVDKTGGAPNIYVEAVGIMKVTPDTPQDYDHLPPEIKPPLLEDLTEKQHGLCVYCERRIHARENGSGSRAHIEHWHPRHSERGKHDSQAAKEDDKLSIEYRNMFACCDGATGDGEQCCDKKRKNIELHVDPAEEECRRRISYCPGSGHMRGADSDDGAETDITVLNLNERQLVANRKSYISEYLRRLFARCSGGSAKTRNELEKEKQRILALRQWPEYGGIILAMIDKRLRQYGG